LSLNVWAMKYELSNFSDSKWVKCSYGLFGWFICLFLSFDCSIFETRSCCVAHADLKLAILLPQSPECWDYRQASLPWLIQLFLDLHLKLALHNMKMNFPRHANTFYRFT
jgi:hypothetical protein